MSPSATRGSVFAFASLERRELFAAAVPAHLLLAQRSVLETSLANNLYTNGAYTVQWAGLNGKSTTITKADCTTYITALMKQAYGFTEQQFVDWFRDGVPLSSPTAKVSPNLDTYYAKAVANQGLEAYTKFSDLKAGDLFISDYIDNSGALGHMGILESDPVVYGIVNGMKAWDIKVIDVTGANHTSTDTRNVPDATETNGESSGVGRGTMRFYTDTAGNLVTWSWSAIGNAYRYDPATAPIRFVKLPPVVNNATFSYQEGPTVTVDFQRAMNAASVSPTDLTITNTTTNQTFTASGVSMNADASAATFTLPAGLTNGQYRFGLGVDSVFTVAGNGLAAPFTLNNSDTFILQGDINRDRAVNFDDLLVLARNYGTVGQTYSQGDLNYSANGAVDFDDLLILARNYGVSPFASTTTIAASSASATATSTTTRQRVAATVLL